MAASLLELIRPVHVAAMVAMRKRYVFILDEVHATPAFWAT
jgi:hypothetical protein